MTGTPGAAGSKGTGEAGLHLLSEVGRGTSLPLLKRGVRVSLSGARPQLKPAWGWSLEDECRDFFFITRVQLLGQERPQTCGRALEATPSAPTEAHSSPSGLFSALNSPVLPHPSIIIHPDPRGVGGLRQGG